ncbi:GIY-YIG nuclease family protein [Legionella cardiaca]|uniref:GIY-YIG nuclease family protein n=1 Tax=Legionella cardiaca TaxID=1071983 RepID=A0ABY8AQM0_9GAMM|nr:GIY-YIG nuclease family protein [Legionella cardiaca]WED42945.1 GIY-YIG nuclease family protein [Legionella cardiaca]
MNEQCYWVYILLCQNNSYYTGYTNNLVKRYQSHVSGTGKCKYTRSFKPIAIARCWKISGDKAQAMRLERYIKKLSRQEKEKIIAEPLVLNHTLNINFLVEDTDSVEVKIS